LLKLDGAKGLPTIEMSDETDIGVGTPIVAIGYPGSVSQIVDPTLEPTFKDGTVSAQRTQAGIPFYEVSAASTPGMSGGPVVDMEGRVIGIVSQAPAQESQSFNLMASASIARDMMRSNDVTPQEGPNDERYREGLEQLFAGECADAVKTFDAVLAADKKHQQAFEIRQQASKRASEGSCASGGSFPFAALVPLVIGAVGVVSVVRRRRKAAPVSAPEVAAPAPAAPSAPPAAPPAAPPSGDTRTCANCGHVHDREVTFCTKCGSGMKPGVAAASLSAPTPAAVPSAVPAPVAAERSKRDRTILIGSGAAVLVAILLFVVMRGGDEGSLLPTPSPTASAAPRAEGPDLNGTWESSYGPVTLVHDAVSGDDPVEVTGSWLQGPDKEGEITGGTFDPKAGTLEITYTETWSDVEGTATFELSEDGSTLEGSYEQENSRGEWILAR
jgi:hypothetical protein